MKVPELPNHFSRMQDGFYKNLFSKQNIIAAACGMITFPATIGLFQHIFWKQLNLGAHHRIAPLCGFLTVGTGSFLSCFVVSTVHDAFLGVYPMVSLTIQDVVTFTMLSVTQYYLLSKRFSRPLPSHVLKPGAFAQKCVVLHDYNVKVSESQKRQIQYIGRSHGCHTCGKVYSPFYYLYKIGLSRLWPNNFKMRAPYYADHSPPVALAFAKGKGSANGVLYPQCQSCSNLQSTCVRAVLASNTSSLPKRGFVTHAIRFKMWKIWLPWPLLISSDSLLRIATDWVQFIIDKL